MKTLQLSIIALAGIIVVGIISFAVINSSVQSNSTCQGIKILEDEIWNCPGISTPLDWSIINSTGFQICKKDLADYYVLKPGQQGTITYEMVRGMDLNWPPVDETEIEIGKDTTFYHKKDFVVEQNVTTYDKVLPPVGTEVKYVKTCYSLPYETGIRCESGPGKIPPKVITVSAQINTHEGVTVSYEPELTKLGFNSSKIIKATVKVDDKSPNITYGMVLSPGVCRGPMIPLTVAK